MNGCWRWLLLVAVSAAAACSTRSVGHATGGQGGLTLDFGAGGMRDCSPPSGGEGGVLGSEAGAAASCATSEPVDYATQVAPILGTCHGEVCHDFSDTSTLRAFIAAPAPECCDLRELIAPGHPERSYFLDKLRGGRLCYGSRMPLDRGVLPAADLLILEAWICQGAPLP